MTHYRDWAYEAAGLLLVALLVAMVGLYFHWGPRAFGCRSTLSRTSRVRLDRSRSAEKTWPCSTPRP